MGKVEREPIPESRKKHFTQWPGSRVPKRLREIGRRGVAETREELSHHPAYEPHPDEPVDD